MKTKLLFTILIVLCLSAAGFAQPVCGGSFYDNGGPGGPYAANSNQVVTICPNFPGDVVSLNFTSFATEVQWDGLYIYDGPSTSSPQISSSNPAGSGQLFTPGAYWGTVSPGLIQATNPAGCLTFRFVSDGSTNLSGWIADVSCSPFAECNMAPSDLTIVANGNNSAVIDWEEEGMAMGWALFVTPCGTTPPNMDSPIIEANTHPFVLTGLMESTCYDVYVRTNCGPFDYSEWSGPLTISTTFAPDCGETFYDNGGAAANYFHSSNEIITICPENANEKVKVTFDLFEVETSNDGLYVFNGNTVEAPQILSSNGAGNVPGGMTGAFWGDDAPGPFYSSSPDGCLTFQFRSNVSIAGGGWVGSVECFLPTTELIAFLDENGNNIKDASEVAFTQGSFTIEDTATTTESALYSPGGSFFLNAALFPASYDLSYNVSGEYAAYYAVAPSGSYQDITFSGATSVYYFPVVVAVPFNDIYVSISSTTPRPGLTYTNTIYYTNIGITPGSGTLTFVKDPTVTITNVFPSGTVANTNGFSFLFTDLAPFETRTITVTMLVPTIPTVQLGDLLTNSAMVTPPSNDIDPDNNSFSSTQVIVGSYDPNDIMESHGPEIQFDQFGADEYLYYRIRFQNTGTASALTVRVEDILNPQLDANTVQMIGASHNYAMTRTGGQLVWQFDDIDLPASSVNEPGSNGFVFFKVKPVPGFEVGDIIPNTAQIFFDTNPAIVTNTFNTEFVEVLGVADSDSSSLKIYPNPAKDFLNISSQNAAIESVSIYDVIGNVVLRNSNVGNTTRIDIAALSGGIYFVELVTNSKQKVIKKLIVQ